MKEDQVGMVLALIGSALNANAIIWCFPIWLVGNVIWINHWRKRKEWSAMVLSSVFLAMNVYGWLTWACH